MVVFQSKKGDISIQIIIVAAICLVVLIVLVAVFTGKLNVFGKSYTSTQKNAESKVCNSQPGYCIDTIDVCNGRQDSINNYIDCAQGQKCCITK